MSTTIGQHGMPRAAWLILACFLALAAATLGLPTPEAVVAEARRYFDDAVIARGQRYTWERRLLFWASTMLQLGWLLVLACSAHGRRLAAWCKHRVGHRWLAALLLIAFLYFLGRTLLSLPLDIGRWAHQTAWGMTERPFTAWLREHVLATAVYGGIEAVVLVGLYGLMRWWPRWWWLAATAGSVVFAMLFAFLMPVLISPLFNTFTPIQQTKWADWEQRLRRLVADAGVPVGEILVMNASSQSKHTNAYFAGFGSTRRIVLYDNLLEKNTPAEVESVLGHELGHWLHDHITRGIALGGAAALVGLYLLSLLLRRAATAFGWDGPGDPASLPLVLLLSFLGSWLVMPAANAVSRHFERQADAMALELARDPDVFISAEKKLAIDNLGNVAPAPWNVWLFSTHPPPVERIAMAEAWRQAHSAERPP
ncbi:MAG: M48 family metallopeptidase [Gemmataceae bacterium]|nr:M48 family metallopeptidase [Gemmataceae bacterium]